MKLDLMAYWDVELFHFVLSYTVCKILWNGTLLLLESGDKDTETIEIWKKGILGFVVDLENRTTV